MSPKRRQGRVERDEAETETARRRGRAKRRARRERLPSGKLASPNWGGKRPGAGRKPNGAFAEVAHGKRPKVPKGAAVLITLDLAPGLPALDGPAPSRMLAESFAAADGRFGLSIVAHSLYPDHLHLIVRARDRAVLSRGMTGLCVRMARNLNALWRRGGKIFADRYESRALLDARELGAARRAPCAWRTTEDAGGPWRPTTCGKAREEGGSPAQRET